MVRAASLAFNHFSPASFAGNDDRSHRVGEDCPQPHVERAWDLSTETPMATDEAELSLRKKLAHIDLMLIEHDRTRAQMSLSILLQGAQLQEAQADAVCKQQEMQIVPWRIALVMAVGAALFGARRC
jgi:hypothetical protein